MMALPKRAALFVLATLVITTCSGCGVLGLFDDSPEPREPIENPLTALSQINITPVVTPPAFSGRDWTGRLRDALLEVQNIREVIVTPMRPAKVAAAPAPANGNASKTTALPELRGGAQGLLKTEVLTFDPYYPPRLVIGASFYLPRRVLEIGDDPILHMERHGSPPRTLGNKNHEPWLNFQRTFDLNDEATARLLRRYCQSLGDGDRGTPPYERIARDSDRFVEFAFHEMLKECFSKIETKEQETDGFLRKLFAGPAE